MFSSRERRVNREVKRGESGTKGQVDRCVGRWERGSEVEGQPRGT